MSYKNTCMCPSCSYGRKIRDLIERTPVEDDKSLIEDVYSRLFHTEDDRDYYKILVEGYRAKHGPMGLAEAVQIVSDEEKKYAKCAKLYNVDKSLFCVLKKGHEGECSCEVNP